MSDYPAARQVTAALRRYLPAPVALRTTDQGDGVYEVVMPSMSAMHLGLRAGVADSAVLRSVCRDLGGRRVRVVADRVTRRVTGNQARLLMRVA